MATDDPSTTRTSALAIHPKVAAGALAGSVTVILIWAIGAFTKVQIPPEVASGGTTIITAIIAYVVPGAS